MKKIASMLSMLLILISANAQTLRGDVNGDGKINSTDALLILQSATGVVNLTDNQKKLADVNGDGKVNAVDLTLVRKYLANFPGTGIGE